MSAEARAMTEQGILKIIWPPDGRIPWEERHKTPPIERALNHLLDVVEGNGTSRTTVQESQALTEKAVILRQQGMKLAQIGDALGLTAKAVSSRLSDARKKRQESQGNPRDLSPNPGDIKRDISEDRTRPQADDAALRSAAPDQLVEANELMPDADSRAAPNSPRFNDFWREPAKVPGLAPLQEDKPEQSGKPTIRNDQIVQESGEVRPGIANPENPEKPLQASQKIERGEGKEWAKIPHVFDAKIIALKKEGKTCPEIAEALQQEGINCTDKDMRNRIFRLRKKGELIETGKERLSAGQRPVEPATQKDDIPFQPVQASPSTEDKPAKDVMLLPSKEPAETIKPAFIRRILELHDSGMTPKTISDTLEEYWGKVVSEAEIKVVIIKHEKGMLQ
jgi:hypothetical protein